MVQNKHPRRAIRPALHGVSRPMVSLVQGLLFWRESFWPAVASAGAT